MLAVAGEGVVLRAHGATAADLGGLLPEERGPQAELTLALQRGGLLVDATDEHEVAIEAAQLVVAQRVDDLVVLGVVDALTLGGEELHHVGAAVGCWTGFAHYCRIHRDVVVHTAGRRGGDVGVAHGHSCSLGRPVVADARLGPSAPRAGAHAARTAVSGTSHGV